jgi:hypothetical protein
MLDMSPSPALTPVNQYYPILYVPNKIRRFYEE